MSNTIKTKKMRRFNKIEFNEWINFKEEMNFLINKNDYVWIFKTYFNVQ